MQSVPLPTICSSPVLIYIYIISIYTALSMYHVSPGSLTTTYNIICLMIMYALFMNYL